MNQTNEPTAPVFNNGDKPSLTHATESMGNTSGKTWTTAFYAGQPNPSMEGDFCCPREKNNLDKKSYAAQ